MIEVDWGDDCGSAPGGIFITLSADGCEMSHRVSLDDGMMILYQFDPGQFSAELQQMLEKRKAFGLTRSIDGDYLLLSLNSWCLQLVNARDIKRLMGGIRSILETKVAGLCRFDPENN